MNPDWASGFFSGEGCTYVRKVAPAPPRRNGEYRYISMSVGQKNKRTLEQFHQAVGGLGRIHFNSGRPECRWSWEAQGAAAEEVMKLLWPSLSREKRWQYLRVRRTCRMFRRQREHKTYTSTPPSLRGLVPELSV